jgi:hypothetical protein
MFQPFFLELAAVTIQERNLLKLGMVIDSYNDHVRLLSPEPVGWFWHHQLYSGLGADIVMESISLRTPRGVVVSVKGMLRHQREGGLPVAGPKHSLMGTSSNS